MMVALDEGLVGEDRPSADAADHDGDGVVVGEKHTGLLVCDGIKTPGDAMCGDGGHGWE
jgi:hypothetical protein